LPLPHSDAASPHSRAEDTELIAFRVPKHHPGLFPLSNVSSCGSEREQTLDLSVSVVWAKVEVQPVLCGLQLWNGHEQEPRKSISRWSDLELVRIFVDDNPIESPSPPTSEGAGVAGLNDRLLPLEGH
jgi:hypothetical protein